MHVFAHALILLGVVASKCSTTYVGVLVTSLPLHAVWVVVRRTRRRRG
jgi:hypothetical protein